MNACSPIKPTQIISLSYSLGKCDSVIANFISKAINTVYSSGPDLCAHAPLVQCQVVRSNEDYALIRSPSPVIGNSPATAEAPAS